ncbi:hypothetical protein C5167_045218 [Papaver somniferum]|uniref:Uncharacterized protein n=1 Tax=Papaver somniferum TaxID=3469 RepID=A0A4Y7LAC9_PAPSO|nr:uncharacterized protein At1g76070-like [Papaver somniferum]RZC82433.1 hypothetical protein C5167_045218 [Papaver somniferum]
MNHHQQSSSDDYPPNSISLKKEEELDWLSKTGGLFERNYSTKPSPSRSISHSRSSSASQRFFTSLKSKASVIGLPKPQNSCFVVAAGGGRRNSKSTVPTKSRLFFPKRSRSKSSSSAPPLSEPSSPKVSCIGRVRSTKESFVAKSRSFRFRNSIRSVDDESKKNSPSSSNKPHKTGFWSSVRSVFRIGSGKKKNLSGLDSSNKISKSPSEEVVAAGESKSKGPAVSEPPSLGGLKRFTSGRKSGSWGGGLDDESGEFEGPVGGDRGSVFSRRGSGQPMEIDCSARDWVTGGPASV